MGSAVCLVGECNYFFSEVALELTLPTLPKIVLATQGHAYEDVSPGDGVTLCWLRFLSEVLDAGSRQYLACTTNHSCILKRLPTETLQRLLAGHNKHQQTLACHASNLTDVTH